MDIVEIRTDSKRAELWRFTFVCVGTFVEAWSFMHHMILSCCKKSLGSADRALQVRRVRGYEVLNLSTWNQIRLSGANPELFP